MAPQTSSRLDYEDYAAIPDDGRRHEIIDGEHYVNPAPNVLHQIILSNLTLALLQFVRPRRLGRVLSAPLDILLDDHTIVQPDLVFVAAERAQIITRRNIVGAPDLVIEILSDSTRRYDERVKYDVYERAGVSEYWIVDPEEQSVSVFRRAGEKFVAVPPADPITTPLLPAFTLPLADVFEM